MSAKAKVTHLFKKITSKLFSKKYLLVTNTALSGVLLGLGDGIIQTIEIKCAQRERLKLELERDGNGLVKKEVEECSIIKYDFARTGRMLTIGTLMGPFNHGWYTLLDKMLIGNSLKTVVKKIVLDETCGAPFFAFCFFMGMGILEGNSIKKSFQEFRQKFWTVWKADVSVWPAAQFFNFYFLPPKFRVMYVALVTLGWTTFLSYIKHKDFKKSQENSSMEENENKKPQLTPYIQ